jgi:hypothetical protein
MRENSRRPKEMPYSYVNRYYRLNVGVGQRVQGRSGVRLTGEWGYVMENRANDQYVHVKFDGAKFPVPVHPMDLDYPACAGAVLPKPESLTADPEV